MLRIFIIALVVVSNVKLIAQDQAMREARQEVAAEPNSANAHYNLGLKLMQSIETSLRKESGLSKYEESVAQESEASFKKALSLSDNSHGRALIMLGWLYKFEKEYQKAIPYLEKATMLPPESADYVKAVEVLSVCYYETGQKDKALSILKQALEFHKNDGDLLKKLKALSQDQQSTNLTVPSDEKSKQAIKLGQDFQKQMEQIMNSSDPESVKQKKMEKAQQDYQEKIKKLYSTGADH